MKTITTCLWLMALFFSVSSQASQAVDNETIQLEKKFNIGISSVALVISSDDYGDDDFTGWGVTGSYAFSDNVAARLDYYSLEHDNFSEIEVSGFEGTAQFGSGLLNYGFKWYIGVGAYTETIESDYVEEDISGVHLKGGLGYNWEQVALDFSVGFRTTEDYEDFSGDNDLSATTGALSLSYRF